MKTYIFSFFFFLTFFFSLCAKTMIQEKDFLYLMGEKTKNWKYVETPSDFSSLNFYQKNYEKEKERLFQNQEGMKFPKIIHFIWLGHKSLSKDKKSNIRSWIKKHPGWKFQFWTDKKRKLPHSLLDTCYIQTFFPFFRLKEFFEDTKNYVEKEALLRYEILNAQGGVFVDVDTKCVRNIEAISSPFHFFCSLNFPHIPIAGDSIAPSFSVIGSVSSHPILQRCIDLIQKKWSKTAKYFPHSDKESLKYRLSYRLNQPFDEAIKEKIGERDIIFPPAFFHKMGQEVLFGERTRDFSFVRVDSTPEEIVSKKISRLIKKIQIINWFNMCLAGMLFASFALFVFFRKKRDKTIS